MDGDGYVLEILELLQWCQGHFRGSRGKVGFRSRHCRGKGPHLALRGESPGFPRVLATILGFLSSYDRVLRNSLVSPQERQSPCMLPGASGFLSSCCQGRCFHLELRPEPRVPLLCQHGSRGSSGVSPGESGLVSCGDVQVHSPLVLEKQCQLPVMLT